MATTTPNYGWDVPTSTDYVKDGAVAIETLGDDIDATLGTALNNKLHAGLVLIKSQAITSGVSSITVTGAFNSTYDAYKIVFSGIACNSIAGTGFQLSTVNSGYYASGITGSGNYSTASGTLTFANTNNGTSYDTGIIAATGAGGTTGGYIELQNPFLATSTALQHFASDPRTGGFGLRFGSGYHSATTSYSSFTYLIGGGLTFTGGNIAVYGYAKD